MFGAVSFANSTDSMGKIINYPLYHSKKYYFNFYYNIVKYRAYTAKGRRKVERNFH